MKHKWLGVLWLLPFTLSCEAADSGLTPMENVVAINVLLEVDDTMQRAARRVNGRLGAGNPKHFAFDATHVPHLSVLHRYVRQADLPMIYATVERISSNLQPQTWTLTATGYESTEWDGGTLLNITVRKSAQLAELQDAVVNGLRQFVVEKSTDRAFARSTDATRVDDMTIDYVATFEPKRVGDGFKPHITVGIGSAKDVARAQSQPFAAMTFHPTGLAVYQLGNLGTARRKLH